MTATARDLEVRYRKLLRAYPASWQRARLEEVLAVLLDDAAATQRQHTTWADRIDLIGHGLAARLELAASVLPTSVRRQVGLLSLASGAALSVVMLLLGEVHLGAPTPNDEVVLGTFGPFLTLSAVTYIGWLVMAATAMCGGMRLYRSFAVLTLLGSAAVPVASLALSMQRAPMTVHATLALLNVAALLMQEVPRRQPAMAAPLAGLAVALLAPDRFLLNQQLGDQRYSFYWLVDGNYRLATIAHAVPEALIAVLVVIAATCFAPRLRHLFFAAGLTALLWVPLAAAGSDVASSRLAVGVLSWVVTAAVLVVGARRLVASPARRQTSL